MLKIKFLEEISKTVLRLRMDFENGDYGLIIWLCIGELENIDRWETKKKR